MNKVYVVMGQCGEYSDHQEWSVAAYRSESLAAERVANATRRGAEVEAKLKEGYNYNVLKENEFDPDMRSDYTGTEYYIMPVDLVDG